MYDIIGDVHGYAGELKMLMTRMGYSLSGDFWSHPTRKAIFVGDIVSRGPFTREVLSIVRGMVDNGSALAILGNHELNFAGYFTLNENDEPYFQLANSNKAQMERIREQFKGSEHELKSYAKWIRRLPFFLEIGNLRAVHAYWCDKNKREIENGITKGKITRKLLKEIALKETPFAKAVWQTTRGIEINLPANLIIRDEKGVPRSNFRVKWWRSPQGKTFKEISYGNRFSLPEYQVPKKVLVPFEIYNASKPILFFGHYCVANGSLVVAPNLCCTDNCIAGAGRLAAYRYNGEEKLTPDNFLFQERLAAI